MPRKLSPEVYETSKAAVDLALVLRGSHISPWPLRDVTVPNRLAVWIEKLDAVRFRIFQDHDGGDE